MKEVKLEDITVKDIDLIPMTVKERKYADKYIETGNGVLSYKHAGFTAGTPATAATEGSKLLRKPNVAKYIELKLQEISDATIADAKEVLQYLTSVMRSETKEETLIGVGAGHQKITKIAIQEKDKIKAAELLGKRYGTWIDRVEQTEPVTIKIQRKQD